MKLFSKISVTLSFALIAVSTCYVHSQDIEQIGKQKRPTIGGYVSANQILTFAHADTITNSDYTGYYSGSLNFTYLGVNIPLTFVYANRMGNFSYPFNQFGIHPSYKWVRTHIGYASMNFSPYTLNGHLFCGIGAEIDPPGIVRASLMFGRLRKAIEYDTSRPQQIPSYSRVGYGIKVGVVNNQDYLDLIMFRSGDRASSIDSVPVALQILPEENTVMSIMAGKSIAKNLVFTTEYASSYLTTDTRNSSDSSGKSILKPPTWFMPIRTTTIHRKAIKANVTYSREKFSVGLGYERVDPEYRTLGSYYFTNNTENATVNFSVNMLKNKLNLSANTGIQRDNIQNSKLNNNTRFVGSGNINIVPGEKLNVNMSYSNFTSYTNVRSSFDYINQSTPLETLDTLNYRQISSNYNLNTSYVLSGNKDRRQTLSLNLTYQSSNESTGTDSTNSSDFYNASASHILSLTPQNLSISSSINFNRNNLAEINTTTWGPSINISKLLLDKTLRTSLNFAFNTSRTGTVTNSNVFNIRAGSAYTIKKQHNFNLSLLFQTRKKPGQDITYTNSTISFGYAYNFNIIKPKESSKP